MSLQPVAAACDWQGFSATQLGQFSVTQAAVITSSQYQSLDDDKQQTIRNILSTISDDLLFDPTQDNAGHCPFHVYFVLEMLRFGG